MEEKKYVKEEQLIYANILDIGMKLGLVSLIITFFIYILGILPPKIPISDLPNLWHLKAYKFVEITGIGMGWSWLKNVTKSDYLNYLPIAFLGALTIFCYIGTFFVFLKKKDLLYIIITLLEIIILLLAASGFIHVGH